MFMTGALLLGIYFGWMLRKKRETILTFFKLKKVKKDES